MHVRRLAGLLTAALALAAPTTARQAQAQVIDTRGGTGAPPGGYLLYGPDEGVWISRIGQTFLVPVGATSLTSLHFWARSDQTTGVPTPGQTVTGTVRIAAWDGTAPIGPDLWSAPFTPPQESMALISFTPDVAVTPGAVLTAYFTREGSESTRMVIGTAPRARLDPDRYADGALWGIDQSNIPPEYRNWEDLTLVIGFNGAATLSAVPEPSTYLLLGSGLLALGTTARRRRRV